MFSQLRLGEINKFSHSLIELTKIVIVILLPVDMKDIVHPKAANRFIVIYVFHRPSTLHSISAHLFPQHNFLLVTEKETSFEFERILALSQREILQTR